MRKMPIELIIIFGVILVSACCYNFVYMRKLNKLMSYLKQHHPEIYEQIRIKPNFGPFYSGNVYKASIDYAKNHEPLDDPIAERLLADYAEFSQKGIWIFGGVSIIFTLGAFIWGVLAS